MAKSLSEFLSEDPVDRTQVNAHNGRMLAAIEEFRRIEFSPDRNNEECRG